ncbi:hypothetical protein Tsp_13992 [Trichinella spiralis]|uniref:hypothetical protein n=1 Tax=Trichinella spiralis TaxID=6334 RepID=UPI0001EFE092|nr:hypothetical protein Tsp_13992 [Trichinella spiralis]
MASKFDIFRFGPFRRQPIDKAIYCFLTLVVLVKGCDIKAAFLYLSRPIKNRRCNAVLDSQCCLENIRTGEDGHKLTIDETSRSFSVKGTNQLEVWVVFTIRHQTTRCLQENPFHCIHSCTWTMPSAVPSDHR